MKTKQERVEVVKRVIEEVAAQARPPLNPIEVYRGDGMVDRGYLSRLRGIVGLRLKAAGFRTVEIASAFAVAWETVDGQMRSAKRLREHPRYAHFFEDGRGQDVPATMEEVAP